MKEILQSKYGEGIDIKESPKKENERKIDLNVYKKETIENNLHFEHKQQKK